MKLSIKRSIVEVAYYKPDDRKWMQKSQNIDNYFMKNESRNINNGKEAVT